MDEQRKEVSALIKKAGVTATEHDISHRDNPAGAPVLKEITGARKPNGPALPPPGQDAPQKPTKPVKKSNSQRRRSRRSAPRYRLERIRQGRDAAATGKRGSRERLQAPS